MIGSPNLLGTYEAFGVFGTIFRELEWKTPIFYWRAIPETPNASRTDVLRQVFAEAGGALDRAELEAALRHVFAEAADDAATGGSSGPAAGYGWSAVAAAIWGVGQPGGDSSRGRVCH
jgi:hypothetical protein